MPPILAIAGVVAVLLAVYLVVAMLAPEIFG
jgi:K+-transporting ATPase KdpF subunit